VEKEKRGGGAGVDDEVHSFQCSVFGESGWNDRRRGRRRYRTEN
jgi:hypothetical protein